MARPHPAGSDPLRLVLLVLAAFAGPRDSWAADGNLLRVPDDFPSVASAVAAAFPGQTVGVRAGTYTGEFVPRNNVAVLGGYDPTFTVRDPEQFETILVGDPRVVHCDDCGAGAQTLIDGFTMRAPPGNLTGGIVLIIDGSPTLSHCRFENGVGFRGGAVSLAASSSQLSDNVFLGNASTEVGSALSVFSCNSVRVIRCHFEDNSAAVSGTIFFDNSSAIEVRDCTFESNSSAFYGGGILVQQTEATITGAIFWENQAVNGAAIGVYSSSPCLVTGCTLVRNTGNGSVFASSAVEDLLVTRSIIVETSGAGLAAEVPIENHCNDVWSNSPDYSGVAPGANSFSLDPLFCDDTADDFHLLVASPCAAGNAPAPCGLIGALDIQCGGTVIRIPDDHPTVMDGLAAASAGDTVAVAEGRYVEHVTLKDRIVLLGGYRIDFAVRDPIVYPTILDAGGFLSTVVAQNAESPPTVLDGFVITGGNRSGGYGGGLDCFAASPTIRNNVFRGNHARQGGAIACRAGALPLITGNVIVGNHSLEHPGGAIYVESAAHVTGNTLDGNRGPSASGVAIAAGAEPTVTRNIIVNGAGIGVYAENGAEPTLGCNDVWMNVGGNYFGVFPGPNALSLDPLFCAGDERLLSEGSPCAPENAPQACGLIGARGVGCGATTGIAGAAPPAEPWIGIVTPNPAAGLAALGFGLPGTAPVRLTVHDAAGRCVRTLVDRDSEPGDYRAAWDGTTDRGSHAASGVYFFRLVVGGRSIGDRKLVFLR
jgi:predicted outer membrane repeat protein